LLTDGLLTDGLLADGLLADGLLADGFPFFFAKTPEPEPRDLSEPARSA
jgi:hypothetical protein